MDHDHAVRKTRVRCMQRGWDGMVWYGMGYDGMGSRSGPWARVWLYGIARLAAVKENDCNYASLFLNFHAVHLAGPALPPREWAE